MAEFLPAGRQGYTLEYADMHYVYALRSEKNGRLYIGMTTDIQRRLKQHNSGKTSSNRRDIPFKVIYTKSFAIRNEAREYEKYLKSGSGREFLKQE